MRATIFWIADVPVGRLAIVPRPRGEDWLEDEILSLRQAGVDVLVSLLTTEEAAELGLVDEATRCAACGVRFLSFPIPDRGVPVDDRELVRLVRELAGRVAGGEAVAVHCRQGWADLPWSPPASWWPSAVGWKRPSSGLPGRGAVRCRTPTNSGAG